MTSQLLEGLIAKSARRQQPPECFGKNIGQINRTNYCWAAKGCARDRFYSNIRPEILHHLDGWFGSLASEDHVILSVYMIGKTKETASPTVLFISENGHYRKKARSLIKDSGILKKYPDFKTADISQEPGWDGKLEQLASGQETETRIRSDKLMTEVFHESSRSLQLIGMPIYVRHGSSMRLATANAIRLRDRIFYLAPYHTFFSKPHISNSPISQPDDGFEIDSDTESELEELEASITSIGSQSPDAWSEKEDSSDGAYNSASSDAFSCSSPSTSIFDVPELSDRLAVPRLLEQVNDEVARSPEEQMKCLPQEIAIPPLDHLELLGVLVDGSKDQDWALVEVIKNGSPEVSSSLLTKFPDLSSFQIAYFPQDEAKIVTNTTSSGRMTGTISGTPSYTLVPNGKSFQEVFAINLDGHLRVGDCGSFVFDAATGKLFGHIVAGCRNTGFAYVMAAHHVFPELEKSAQRLKHYAGQLSNNSKPTVTKSSPLLPSLLQEDYENLGFSGRRNEFPIARDSLQTTNEGMAADNRENVTAYRTVAHSCTNDSDHMPPHTVAQGEMTPDSQQSCGPNLIRTVKASSRITNANTPSITSEDSHTNGFLNRTSNLSCFSILDIPLSLPPAARLKDVISVQMLPRTAMNLDASTPVSTITQQAPEYARVRLLSSAEAKAPTFSGQPGSKSYSEADLKKPAQTMKTQHGLEPSDAEAEGAYNAALQRISHTSDCSTENTELTKTDVNLGSLKLFEKRSFVDRPFTDLKRTVRSKIDVMDMFLQFSGGSPIPSWKTESIKSFLRRSAVPSYENRETRKFRSARAWVDCRSLDEISKKSHPQWLNPKDFAYFLMQQRFGPFAHTDSFRQLIHITHLDRDYILALVESAWWHQAEALRESIYKHLDFEASMRVFIPTGAFKVAHLELNIPYLALRESFRSATDARPLRRPRRQPRKVDETDESWTDLSFLNMESSEGEKTCQHIIHLLHTSVNICIWDSSKWVAYAFTNYDLDGQFEDVDGEDQAEDSEDDVSEYGKESMDIEDILACDGKISGCGTVIGLEEPLWDPRLYWLRITEIRFRAVQKEWEYIVKKIEATVSPQVTKIQVAFSGGSRAENRHRAHECLEWAVKAMSLLRRLREQISRPLRAWRMFDGPEGDKGFFLDMIDADARTAFRTIRELFVSLMELEEKLISLYQGCQESAKIIELYMGRESVRLNYESAELSREANLLNRDNLQVALNTNRVSLAENFNAAFMFSASQIMTPVVVVTGYFSTQDMIFGFPRDEKRFIVCVIICFVMLKLLNIATFLIRRSLGSKRTLNRMLLSYLDRIARLEDENDLRSYAS